jgi:hypothetical protein
MISNEGKPAREREYNQETLPNQTKKQEGTANRQAPHG